MAVIGITTCRKLEDYRQSILHVGGEPRILEVSMGVERALAGIDGLLLTGGDDVAPSRYGEAAHGSVVEAEPGRDEFEIGLIAAARATKLPMLAICRGIQVLNVACGGTLVQDIRRRWPARSRTACPPRPTSRTRSRTRSGSRRTPCSRN